ncbi:MAG: glycoside hydrolase family 97 protein [Bacteroidaceae bacterium]|nr:glycoside hydrolase family 97 protein [Bacteroidaceae bacterium]MBQ7362678.1 glycoside hydrolase family 97 protein [Bacteroidaceae bacterium]
MRRARFIFFILMVSISLCGYARKVVTAKSPDGQTSVCITLSDRIYYDVVSKGETLLKKSVIGMQLRDRTLGANPALKRKRVRSVNETVKPLFPLKYSSVENNYTLLTLEMKGGYAVDFRLYDDGVAFRMRTSLPGEIEVMQENTVFQLADSCDLVLQQPGGFKTGCEENYSLVKSNKWKKDDRMTELPVLIMGKNQKILLSEFDLYSYPGLFLKGNADNSLAAIQPKTPLEYEDRGDRSQRIIKEADYIAKTSGTRTFPWRYMLITQEDGRLAENTMPVRLAPECRIEDTAWIKPGQTCWDWLNGIPYGPDVTFKGGINLDTYKYFVDFASRNGIPYIIMDEGWALSTRDPYRTNPEVNLPELIRYAKSKNVGIFVWLPWLTVEHNMDLFKKFEEWGIVGTKIDFMDRQDQWMVDFYERAAAEAAKHHIMIDYHGAFHPSGLEYRYPNVLTYEGVRGMEFNGSCRPKNSIWFPFLRNAVGPMDYTPGSMICYQPEYHHGNRPFCAGVGTKAYHLAVFVIFESHLQMLMDNPCRYDMWPDCRDFITGVPVNWDETRVLAAEAGQYIVMAKRKGDKWFIGGITNDKQREVDVTLSFLPEGKSLQMTSFADGVNADRMAMDYLREQTAVNSDTKLHIKMARNGGFAGVISQ